LRATPVKVYRLALPALDGRRRDAINYAHSSQHPGCIQHLRL